MSLSEALAMRIVPWSGIVFMVSAISMSGAFSATIEQCPRMLSERPDAVQSAGAWKVHAERGDRPLEQVGIYLGAMPEPGALVPDSTVARKGIESLSWTLHRNEGDQYWIGCRYVGTTAMLMQPLDQRYRRCLVTYQLLGTGRRQRVNAIDCD